MPRYRYVVDEAAFTTLLALDDTEVAALLPAIESLAESASTPAAFYSFDRRGRKLPSKIFGRFLLTDWPDVRTQTLYILQIDRLDE